MKIDIQFTINLGIMLLIYLNYYNLNKHLKEHQKIK